DPAADAGAAGGARRGQRAAQPWPERHPAGGTTPAGIGPAPVVPGATDGAVFEAFVERCLVPSLRPGQVVLLDNLSAHKGERSRELVAGAGCRLLFLPAYSPDCNPIELAFAKLKQHLRSAGARSADTLLAAIGQAIDAITPADARGFYTHCGFPLTDQ
ncbi:MAG: transposase, partial [Thermomicrobiales bacterium]